MQALPDPNPWVAAVEKIGLGGALVLVIALSLGTAFIFRGPALIRAFNEIAKTISKHKLEKLKIEERVQGRQKNLKSAAEKRRGNKKVSP
jgi:hypothetical protein